MDSVMWGLPQSKFIVVVFYMCKKGYVFFSIVYSISILKIKWLKIEMRTSQFSTMTELEPGTG